ncbi:MAG: FAD-dependent oxidoreductase [Chlamydiales bacterium]
MTSYDYPIIVIGAGAGGLVVAIGAAKAGKKVLLIEKGTYGGDCTNFGCVPSKSLIASSHIAHQMKECAKWGIEAQTQTLETSKVLRRVRNIVEEIRSHEDPEALKRHGVETLTGKASFVDPHTLEVELEDGTQKVTGDQIVICAGSRPRIPAIEGLDQVPYLTNETIFDLESIPERLLVVGGGPIGSELSQAFQRLGSQVTIIQSRHHLLAKEELESRQLIEDIFRHEGINLILGSKPENAKTDNGEIVLTVRRIEDGQLQEKKGTHLLLSSGRVANLENLKLENAGVTTHKKGIVVDRMGRTSVKHIWAAGDITGEAPFTHMAENSARRILYNLLVPWPFKKKSPFPPLIPRVTYTDPEVAAVGLTEEEAQEQYGINKIASYDISLTEVDRAITTGRVDGFIKIITKKWSSKILGATIVAPRGGEMLMEIITAMKHNIPLRKLADIIHPYPIYSQGIRKTADKWLTQTILPSVKKWIG